MSGLINVKLSSIIEKEIVYCIHLDFTPTKWGVYHFSDTSKYGLRCMLIQDRKVVVYALRLLKPHARIIPPMI